MADVLATLEEHRGSRSMLGHPGRIRRWLEIDPKKGTEPTWKADVCCPGCGEFVFNLPETTHPLHGPKEALSCNARVHVTACCGWLGHLRNGVWVADEEV